MLREFSQNHSQQQLENITQQLVHKSQELQESETDRTQLQSRVKKLEKYILVHVCTCTYTCTYMYMYMYMYIHVHVYVYVHISVVLV